MTALDFLRQNALATRVKGIAGGNRVLWSPRDIAVIRDHILKLPERALRDVPLVRKLVEPASSVKLTGGAAVRDVGEADLRFVFVISDESVDLLGDVISVAGWDFSGFAKNPAVLAFHDSGTMPVATSTMPVRSGKALLATAVFPAPGISAASDEIAAAIRAKLLRAASVGFQPISWSFSTDPSRPFGVDFKSARLLEWSTVSLPANSNCLVLGAASDGKSAPRTRAAEDAPAKWICAASTTLGINSSDDPFNAGDAKAQLLASVPDYEDAAKGFLAYDASRPYDAASYRFPFSYIPIGGGFIASKVGWRQQIAKLQAEVDKATAANDGANPLALALSDAKSVVAAYEARLGDVKSARRRAEALALATKAKLLADSIKLPPMSREERIKEAREMRRQVDLMILKSAPGRALTDEERSAQSRLVRSMMRGGKAC